MKYGEYFDRNKARIDQYGQFYYHFDGYFVRFVNGSMVCTARETDPCDRRLYTGSGISLISSSEAKKLYSKEDGLLKDSWLGIPKIQYFAHDVHKGVIVSTRGSDIPERQYIPMNLQGYPVYWANEEALPIGFACRYSKPVTMTVDEKAYFKEALAAGKFIAKLSPNSYFAEELAIQDMRVAMKNGVVPSAYAAGLKIPEVNMLVGTKAPFKRETIRTRFLYTDASQI
jgi:hypothetical protein